MGIRFLLIAFFSLYGLIYGSAQELIKPSFSDLLEQVKKSDPQVDFAALRMAFTRTDKYDPYDADNETRDSLADAIKQKEYAKAIEFAKKVLEKNYLDIDAHSAAFRAHAALDHDEEAEYHRFVRDGLIESVLHSGDGKSAKTAFVVISTDEEYAVLKRLGIRDREQGLIVEDGHHFDVMSGIDAKTGDSIELYFNISTPYGWLKDNLNKSKK